MYKNCQTFAIRYLCQKYDDFFDRGDLPLACSNKNSVDLKIDVNWEVKEKGKQNKKKKTKGKGGKKGRKTTKWYTKLMQKYIYKNLNVYKKCRYRY